MLHAVRADGPLIVRRTVIRAKLTELIADVFVQRHSAIIQVDWFLVASREAPRHCARGKRLFATGRDGTGPGNWYAREYG
jgi:hypothetical protein